MAASESENPLTALEDGDDSPVAQVLGSDPWMRFDIWSGRAWEATDRATSLAIENVNTYGNDAVDGRVMALFHAAQIAKEFSDMVNPLAAVAFSGSSGTVPSAGQAQAIMAMLLDDDD